MAQAAYAPRYQRGTSAPSYAPHRPRVTVTPGQRGESKSQLGNFAFLFAVLGVVLVVFAVLCMVRIGLYSATVQTGLATQEVEANLEQARSVGTTLEVQRTSLSSATRIKTAAQSYKMSAPSEVVAILLPADVVVTDEQGDLSLAGSISVALSER